MGRRRLYLICFVICLTVTFSGCGIKDGRIRKEEDSSQSEAKSEGEAGAGKEDSSQPEAKTDRETGANKEDSSQSEAKSDRETGTAKEDSSQSEAETDKEAGSDKEAETDFDIPDSVVCMQVGDVWDIPVEIKQTKDGSAKDKDSEGSGGQARAGLQWTSSDPEAISVDDHGRITALQEGNAVITCKNRKKEESLCINAYDGFGGGAWWDMEMLTGPDQADTYRNYAQGAYEYGDYSEYVAMHGCAVCCTTTIIRTQYPDEDWTPDKVIRELEPEADSEGWERNYAKSPRKQMPLTLKGISRVLDLKDVKHKYVTEFDKETLADKLAGELRQGRPIIYEAGKGGYHMMILLGIMTDGSVIVSDSVGYDRVRLSTLETVTGQMFSCKKDPERSYFAGRKTAGGYIIVGKE